MSEVRIIRVYNRRLEQALFYLGVDHLSCDKTDDDMTVWTYPDNDKVRQIVGWFKQATEMRRKAGW